MGALAALSVRLYIPVNKTMSKLMSINREHERVVTLFVYVIVMYTMYLQCHRNGQ